MLVGMIFSGGSAHAALTKIKRMNKFISAILDLTCPLLYTQASRKECVLETYFLYFSSKTYVVGTQKNRLNETVLLSTKTHV